MKITAPQKDYAGVVGGVQFSNGTAETDDPNLIAYFRRHGYDVQDAAAEAKPLDKLKVDELKAYAAEHEIDLGEASKKADILAVIAAAEAKPAE